MKLNDFSIQLVKYWTALETGGKTAARKITQKQIAF